MPQKVICSVFGICLTFDVYFCLAEEEAAAAAAAASAEENGEEEGEEKGNFNPIFFQNFFRKVVAVRIISYSL